MEAERGMAQQRNTEWERLPWGELRRELRHWQAEIVRAERAGNQRKVFALQDQVIRSQTARLLAVRHVTSSGGKYTPGVDHEVWRTPEQKRQGADRLDPRDYQPQPARRVLIPKDNGDLRPLGILTMRDRAMQALYLSAIDPVAETHADPHSYGFRKQRCAADAILRCAEIFGEADAPPWALEADIEACFDSISHAWLLKHIPLDKGMLTKWLKAGYYEGGVLHHSDNGLPQGGILSPTLTNMTLDGMETMLTTYFEHNERSRARSKIAFVRYADDFIVAGANKGMLEDEVKSLLANFLSARGMRFSPKKTVITSAAEGFDFLGYHLVVERSLFGKRRVVITPRQKSCDKVLKAIQEELAAHPDATAAQIIDLINPLITGWTRYYTFLEDRERFAAFDREVAEALRRWLKPRFPYPWQGKQIRRFFAEDSGGAPIFTAEDGRRLACARQTPHRAAAPIHPEYHAYDPAWEPYLRTRHAARDMAEEEESE